MIAGSRPNWKKPYTLIPRSSAQQSGAGAANPFASADGSLNAPVGNPNLPSLLTGASSNPGIYATRPPWMVAGVDYHVGIDRGLYPTNASLASAATGSLPTNVTRAGTTLTVAGTGTILDGFDFSVGVGWTCDITGTNCTVSNCNFAVGSSNNPCLSNDGSGSNLITNCEFNINGATRTQTIGISVNTSANATTTFTYCLFQNGYGVIIVASPNNGGETYVIKWCLMRNSGFGYPATHGDWIQYYNNTGTHAHEVDFLYSTFVQDVDISVARAQGLSIFSAATNVAFFDAIRVENNTFVAHKPGTSDVPNSTGAYINFGIIPEWHWAANNGGTILTNYVDQIGMDSWFYGGPDFNGNGPPWGQPLVSGNIDMRTGSVLNSWADQYRPVAIAASFALNHIGLINGQVVGTMRAYSGPIAWSITAGNGSGFYAIDNSGNITVTAAGVSGITAGTANLTCLPANVNATNGTATSAVATITIS